MLFDGGATHLIPEAINEVIASKEERKMLQKFGEQSGHLISRVEIQSGEFGRGSDCLQCCLCFVHGDVLRFV